MGGFGSHVRGVACVCPVCGGYGEVVWECVRGGVVCGGGCVVGGVRGGGGGWCSVVIEGRV